MTGTNRAFSRATLGLGIILCSSIAWATPLLGPSTLAECSDFGVFDDPVSCTVSGNEAFAAGSLTLSPFVSLTAQSSSGPIDANFDPGAGVVVSVDYSFQVVGGTPGDVVPIMITTNLTSAGSSFSHAEGFAQLVLTSSFGTISQAVCSNGTCGNAPTTFSGTLAWHALSGETGDIQLEAEAQSGDSLVAESASASADPFIFIDPSFAGASNYSILVSPGVGNAIGSAVPEPATFGLAGFALALLAMRVRAKQSKRAL